MSSLRDTGDVDLHLPGLQAYRPPSHHCPSWEAHVPGACLVGPPLYSHNRSGQCRGSSMNPCPCAMRDEENVSSPPRVLAFNPHGDGHKQRKQHRPPRSAHLPNTRGELRIQSLLSMQACPLQRKISEPWEFKNQESYVNSFNPHANSTTQLQWPSSPWDPCRATSEEGAPRVSHRAWATLSRAACAGCVHLSRNFIFKWLSFSRLSHYLQCLYKGCRGSD